MGMLGNRLEKKEAKKEAKLQKFMERYQLNDISPEDYTVIERVANDLVANNLFKAGMALSFAKAEEQAKVGYLSALVEQNWILIRKLDEMSKRLEKLEKVG